jgi:hypothetical protein
MTKDSKDLPEGLRFLEDDLEDITGYEVFQRLGLSKWIFASEEEKKRCDKYLIELAKKHGLKWIEKNRYRIVNDFEQASRERISKAKAEKKRKKRKLLKKLFGRK